jgi:hypothetical protein
LFGKEFTNGIFNLTTLELEGELKEYGLFKWFIWDDGTRTKKLRRVPMAIKKIRRNWHNKEEEAIFLFVDLDFVGEFVN